MKFNINVCLDGEEYESYDRTFAFDLDEFNGYVSCEGVMIGEVTEDITGGTWSATFSDDTLIKTGCSSLKSAYSALANAWVEQETY